MVEDRVARTDQGLACRSARPACLKKLAIATRNEIAAGAKQAAQLAAIRMMRPDSAGHSGAEDDSADLVLAGTGLFEVKGPEYVRPPRHLFRRNEFRLLGPDRETRADRQREKALSSGDAEAPEPVRLDHDGQRRLILRRVRAGQQQTVFCVAGKSKDQIKAFIRGECRQLAWPTPGFEAELRVGTGRGCCEAYQINQQLGSPEQDGFIAAAVRVLQDFATPSDGSCRPADAQPPVGPRAWPYRHGNRGCGEGTPMPSRSGRVPSCTDMRPEAALHLASSLVMVEDGVNPGSSKILGSPYAS